MHTRSQTHQPVLTITARKPTPGQWAALDRAARRQNGLVTEDRGRGATRRLPALRRHGWVGDGNYLTDAGRAVAEAWEYDAGVGVLSPMTTPGRRARRIIILTPEDPEYQAYMAELSAEPLRTQWWEDAESGVEPEVAVSYVMVLIEGRPAAWAGWYVTTDNGQKVLRCCNNYVRREHRHRTPELYAAAYRCRHREVVQPLGLPAVTYLFVQPIPLHLADGWVLDTGPDASGVSRASSNGQPHRWQRLRWA